MLLGGDDRGRRFVIPAPEGTAREVPDSGQDFVFRAPAESDLSLGRYTSRRSAAGCGCGRGQGERARKEERARTDSSGFVVLEVDDRVLFKERIV